MEYNFKDIESKWRQFWAEHKTFKAEDSSDKPKFYGLDMFPYPSGAGLHVGHPLGYIASDIYARFKRLKGFNVLHPMGYDSFGLPAEQYAIQTGQHPAITTEKNLARYREQLDKIGFSFDWDREVRTSSPEYYKWTQWIFKQLFNSWYNVEADKADDISNLEVIFENEGNASVKAETSQVEEFTASEWNAYSEEEQQKILMNYRLTYLADSMVNWCPALGTVLANDEIKDGVSERGGHPVQQKLMRQWSMRITAYAERLIQGLDTIDWADSIKEQQKNWIGKSVGASVHFKVYNSKHSIEVFTTRPDTIFGVNFMVLAPEHELVAELTTDDQKEAIESYQKEASLKTERDRQADVKNITGQFTGAYAIHPFTGDKVQIWIGDYVLAGYGTGAVMAVPAGDQRDWDFANHFGIEILNIFDNVDISEGAYTEKEGKLTNSDFLDGLNVKKAMKLTIYQMEQKGCGAGQTTYRLRDAVFSRQRYWGEPFPVYYMNGIPKMIEDEFLPIALPEVDAYLPTEDGQPPLGNAADWSWCTNKKILKPNEKQNGVCTWPMELNTMPGWAGSSWYFLRYMDPENEAEFVSKEKADYWGQVDLYIGGSEHATGHLLYARFWTKFLSDKGFISFDEPFKKLINQGMILGRSSFVYKLLFDFSFQGNNPIEHIPVFDFQEQLRRKSSNYFLSAGLLGKTNRETFEIVYDRLNSILMKTLEDDISLIKKENKKIIGVKLNAVQVQRLHADVSLVENDQLDIEGFKNWLPEYANAEFILEDDGTYICGSEVEKMSKSKYNVQTPDELVEKFGADTLRCYEMFLGPLEQAKPWDTKGINGVHNFLRKFWRLFHDADNNLSVSEGEADKKALKTLHKTIKKIEDDLNRFSFNTGVSNFMIAVNELTEQNCNNKAVLSDLVVLISPYAPHICEELWTKLGNKAGSLSYAKYPEFNADYLVEANYAYPVSFNGKMRFKLELPTNMGKDDIEKAVLADAQSQKWLEGKAPKKMIVVPGKIVNVVV
ncbi:MAG: leucine--tRNA ligase [Crocinitomicaceae bacterium]